MTHSGKVALPLPIVTRSFEGVASHEEVRRDDNKVLRQLQST